MQFVTIASTRIRVSRIIGYTPYDQLVGTVRVWFIDVTLIGEPAVVFTAQFSTQAEQISALAALDFAVFVFNELTSIPVSIPDVVSTIAGVNIFSTPANFPIQATIPGTVRVLESPGPTPQIAQHFTPPNTAS